MKVANKVIVVTGAGSGIGRELSLLLIKKGAKVAGVDLNPNSLSETEKLAGDNFFGVPFDITDQKAVLELPEKIIARFGVVDGIINNAGIIQKFVDVNDLGFEEINRVINVNFYGTLYLTKSFLPFFLKRPEAHIVNISSMGGFIPFPGQTIYGAAKAAVKILTEGLYAELKETAVRVTVVHPGAIATNITQNSGVGNIGSAQDAGKNNMALPAPKAAEIIIDAMEKDKYRVTVGKDARMLDLLYRINPRYATNLITRKMKQFKH